MKYIRPTVVLLLWLGVMGVFLKQEVLPSLEPRGSDIPLPRTGWEETAREEWLGIFFRDDQIGYIHNSIYPYRGEDGSGSALDSTVWLRLAGGGRENRIRARGFLLIDRRGEIARMEISAASSDPVFALRGRTENGVLVARITAGGETRQLEFPLTISALPLHLFTPLLSAQALRPGKVFTVPVIELLAGLAGGRAGAGPARFEVEENGRVRVELGEVSGELRLDPDGNISEAAFSSGWSLRRQTAGETLAFLGENPAGEPVGGPQMESPGRAEF